MNFFKIEAYIDRLYCSDQRNLIFRQIKLNEIKFLIDGMYLCYHLMKCYQNGEYGGNYDTFYDYLIKFFTKFKPSIYLIIFKSDIGKDSKMKNFKNYSKELNSSSINFDNFKSSPGLFNRPVIIQAIKDMNIPYLETRDMQFLAYYANGYNKTKSFYTIFSRDNYYNVYDLKKGYFSWSYGIELIKNFEKFDENTTLPIFYLSDFLNFVRLKHESWIYFCILNGNKEGISRNFEFIGSKKFEFLLNSMRNHEINNLTNNFWNIRKFYSIEQLEKIDYLIKKFKFEAEDYSFNKSEFDEYSRFIESLKINKHKLMPYLIEISDQPSVFDTKSVNLIFNEIFDILFDRGETVEIFFKSSDSCSIDKKLFKVKHSCRNISDLLKSKNVPENIRALLVSFCLLEKENCEISEHLVIGIIINMMAIHLKKDKILDLYSSKENNGKISKNLSEKYEEILKKIDEENFNYEKIKLVHLINQFQAVYYVMNVLNKLINPSMNSISINFVLNGFFVTMYLSDLNIRNEINEIISENKFLSECRKHFFRLLSDVKNDYDCILFKQMRVNN